ncbi:MAG: ribonuclease P protein component [Patescibacteria group bacterium]|nr:ribonuclease P protein component [Patescibacteria group bacterium]
MYPRKYRLGKTVEIQHVTKTGRAFFNPLCALRFLPSQGWPRFAVVVSTKVAKKAVVRNRLKRQAREFLRKHLQSFAPGDYVFFLRPAAASKTSQELVLQLQVLCDRAKTWKI